MRARSERQVGQPGPGCGGCRADVKFAGEFRMNNEHWKLFEKRWYAMSKQVQHVECTRSASESVRGGYD